MCDATAPVPEWVVLVGNWLMLTEVRREGNRIELKHSPNLSGHLSLPLYTRGRVEAPESAQQIPL